MKIFGIKQPSPNITRGQNQELQLHVYCPKHFTSKSQRRAHVFQTGVSLKAANSTEICMASVRACSLREGSRGSEVAEITAALLSLQALQSVGELEQSHSPTGCLGKIWGHRLYNELL